MVMCMKRTSPGTSSKAERLTITLGDDQRRQVEAIARDRRTSSASIIRLAVDEFIAGNAIDGAARPHSVKSRFGASDAEVGE